MFFKLRFSDSLSLNFFINFFPFCRCFFQFCSNYPFLFASTTALMYSTCHIFMFSYNFVQGQLEAKAIDLQEAKVIDVSHKPFSEIGFCVCGFGLAFLLYLIRQISSIGSLGISPEILCWLFFLSSGLRLNDSVWSTLGIVPARRVGRKNIQPPNAPFLQYFSVCSLLL